MLSGFGQAAHAVAKVAGPWPGQSPAALCTVLAAKLLLVLLMLCSGLLVQCWQLCVLPGFGQAAHAVAIVAGVRLCQIPSALSPGLAVKQLLALLS